MDIHNLYPWGLLHSGCVCTPLEYYCHTGLLIDSGDLRIFFLDPDHIDYPIPANDDGVKSVQFILDNFAKAIKLPKENTSVPNEETSKND